MKRYRPVVQGLEPRTLLSSGLTGPGAARAPVMKPLTITCALDPASDPAHDGVVFSPRVRIMGQTAPGAVVRVVDGSHRAPVARARADARGQFHLTMRVEAGTTTFLVRATDARGRSATTTITVTSGNLVISWNAAALEAIRVDKTPPPVAARALAIVQASVYDAVNNIIPTHADYYVQATPPPSASPGAAAAGAAYAALVALFPGQKATFDAALAASLAGLPHGASTTNGLAFGESVAARILAWRSQDGSTATVNYVPGTAPGQWRPTPPAFAPALLPQWGDVTPFALASGSQFRPPGPPAMDSPEYAAAVSQVESLGAKDSTTRTADQTQIALFWSDGSGTETPPGHWNTIAEAVALQNHDSLVTDARNFALLDIALADAAIACWDAKYTDNFWRPITAIRQGDPTWTPLITTPNFPSYVSGHSTFSAAAAAVLSSLYGPNVSFTVGSDGLPGVTRSFTSFDQAAAEAGISRIYGGIHYAFDNQDGLALGRAVGQYVVQHVLTGPTGKSHVG